MLSKGTDSFRKFLSEVVDEIEVPVSRYEQAIARYESVANWLNREGSGVARFNPVVYTQGSFRLGTVIKPPAGEEYDIDLVCQLDLSKAYVTQKQLKKLVGDEIVAYATAQGMTNRPNEGTRCWTLNYADGAYFHLDSLPAIPDGAYFKKMLEGRGLKSDWTETAIAITDKNSATYEFVSENWHQSNPRGYTEWFKNRMAVQLDVRKRLLAEELRKSIEEVPTWRAKTPLQRAVQLLKKHRDEMFLEDPDNKPISIIITTLAAHSYQNEDELVVALGNIVSRMPQFIENRSGT